MSKRVAKKIHLIVGKFQSFMKKNTMSNQLGGILKNLRQKSIVEKLPIKWNKTVKDHLNFGTERKTYNEYKDGILDRKMRKVSRKYRKIKKRLERPYRSG